MAAVLDLSRARAWWSVPADPDAHSILLLIPLISLPVWDAGELAGNPPPRDGGWGSRANEDVFGGHEEHRFPGFPPGQIDGSYQRALDAAEQDRRLPLDPAQIS